VQQNHDRNISALVCCTLILKETTMTLIEYTLDELQLRNGQGGKPTWIAYKGAIYDVSNSFVWRGGSHQVIHAAGMDLSGMLDKAPHGVDLLEKFPVVGLLKK
jgi:predicted heme/steroid binding protein